MSQKSEVTDILIVYKPKKDKKDKTWIFGENFVKNNKDKAKIIFNGNKYELKKFFEDIINNDDINDINEIKLTLRIFEDIIDLSGIFSDCDSLYSFPDDEKIEENINNCQPLSSIESKEESTNNNNLNTETNIILKKNYLELLNTSNVTNMSYMFRKCNSLITLPDLSKWNTSNVTDMRGMFYRCNSLITLPDLSKWNTSKVKDMSDMFFECNSLISLPDLSKWNTSNVINMRAMFLGCFSL